MSSVELNYTRHGRSGAPVLVLAPSLGATGFMWEPQLAGLGERLDLIAIDHRGHGGSPVARGPYEMADLGREVVALLDRLGLERVAYCGLSLGGMIGQWLAVHVPERVRSLVLICTAARVPAPEAYLERAATVCEVGTPEAVADVVLAGAQDLALGPEHGRDIAQAVPGARFELLEPAAHLASVERAAAVTELIHDHLGGST